MADKAKKNSNKKSEKKTNIFQKIGKFFHDGNSERKKLVWPTIKQTFKNFGVVLSTVFTISIFVGLLDWGLSWLLGLIMNIA